MIWLIVGVIVGLWIWFLVHELQSTNDPFWSVMLGLFLVLPSILTPTIFTFTNANRVAEMRAFSEVNAGNYATLVDKTAAYLSENEFTGKLIEGSLEKMSLSTAVSQRLAEWRDGVNRYNTSLASLQYFNRNIFTGALIPDEVENMKFLIIK